MDKEEAIKILVETAKGYLEINGDEGVMEPGEQAKIEQAIAAFE